MAFASPWRNDLGLPAFEAIWAARLFENLALPLYRKILSRNKAYSKIKGSMEKPAGLLVEARDKDSRSLCRLCGLSLNPGQTLSSIDDFWDLH
jgi:hypothetical protein